MNATDSHPTEAPGVTPLLPVLLTMAIASVVSSFVVSNYLGMGLAVLTLLLVPVALKPASARARIWVIALATIGFALGLMAMLMKIVVQNAS